MFTNKAHFVRGSASAPAVTPFSPTDVAGCTLWLQANSLSLADGDPVTTWADSSGNGNDATASGTARPTYTTGVFNGRPVARFAGGQQMATSGAFGIAGNAPRTLFVVSQATVLSGNAQVSLGTPSTASLFCLLSYVGTWYFFGVGSADFQSDPSDTNLNLHSLSYDGSAVGWRVNGSLLSGFPHTDALDTVNSNAIIGNYSGNNFPFVGDIAEIIIYNSALSDTDRTSVENYLNTKYAIY